MPTFTVFKGSENGDIVQSTTTREVGPDEVLIRVTHSGVCGTDEHQRHRGIVLGHEGVGIIEQLGSKVTTFSLGDRAGWGYIHSSCGNCAQCLTGKENLCPDNETFSRANLDQGSFAHYGIWKAAYIFKIPDTIASEHAGPLMCGGATVFHLLRSFDVELTDRVGVIGVGGLGHMAIQFAGKMGCDVVVFSSTDSKKAEAMELGAKQFVTMAGKDELESSVGKPIKHLIVTTSSPPDWKKFLPIMAPGGVIYPVTVSYDELKLPYRMITRKELRVQGTLVSPRQCHREMIEFAGLHGIKPIIEEFDMSIEGITEAMEKLRKGKMRYRAVLRVGDGGVEESENEV